MLGLTLLAYGTLSLIVNRMAVHDRARQNFCWALPCKASGADSLLNLNLTYKGSLGDAGNALVLDPASAYRWADLAEADLNANKVDAAKYALTRALAAGPGSPGILFRAARFYLRLEDYPETVAKLTAILRNPDLSDYYTQVFSIYRQMDMPLEQILNEGIPHNEAAATSFLSYWIDLDQMDETRDTWTWLKQNSLVDLDAAADYVGFLAKNDLYSDAIQIWADFNLKTEPDYRKTNWVFNGGFESDPADCPFDWDVKSNRDVSASVEKGVNYGGSSALKLAFVGARKSNFTVISQEVLLNAGTWTLRGFMRTSHLKGEQGLYFRVVDADDPARFEVATNGFEGTEEWTSQEKTFSITDATRRLRVELVSPKSRDLNSETSTNVWVDHIQLIPAR